MGQVKSIQIKSRQVESGQLHWGQFIWKGSSVVGSSQLKSGQVKIQVKRKIQFQWSGYKMKIDSEGSHHWQVSGTLPIKVNGPR